MKLAIMWVCVFFFLFFLFHEFDNQVDAVIIKELILHLVFVTFSLNYFWMIIVKQSSKIGKVYETT